MNRENTEDLEGLTVPGNTVMTIGSDQITSLISGKLNPHFTSKLPERVMRALIKATSPA
jgi:hypothetical protein